MSREGLGRREWALEIARVSSFRRGGGVCGTGCFRKCCLVIDWKPISSVSTNRRTSLVREEGTILNIFKKKKVFDKNNVFMNTLLYSNYEYNNCIRERGMELKLEVRS